jgi:exo-beta-1,3-glucanase (GH17 family)/cellulose synthase/poly-beta-1,6-N-acetylglucosamine synthase-like glycosyltransferase
MMRINIIIAMIAAMLTYSVLAYVNWPAFEPKWPDIIQGFSFSPMRAEHNPMEGRVSDDAQIEQDIALLAGKTHAIRTYTVEGDMAHVPAIAKKYSINVALGAWIDTRLEHNHQEVERLIQVADANRSNVVRVIVGNEVILRNDIAIGQLGQYLNHVRAELGVPVSTAEPWHVWESHPELADYVDFIAVHMLPYWEGVENDKAIDYIVDKLAILQALFPNKKIVIAEVGWPSHGRTRKLAVADEAEQATFLRRFLEHAEKEQYTYYLMEAFDQPWKRDLEGSVGAYWGVYNVERHTKFEFTNPIVKLPEWQNLAIISILIAAIIFAILLTDAMNLSGIGRFFLAFTTYILVTLLVWIAYDYTRQYMTVSSVVVGGVMLLGMLGVVMVLLIEAHEWAETLWVKDRRRELKPMTMDNHEWPMVSIHVPAYNEPAEMLKTTLDALAELDYPNFEVIVIDNNTPDEKAWRPVELYCEELGSKFHFYHQSPLAGFKAGALNFALSKTAKQVKIVAVIDSDYCVKSNWLRELVPQFNNEHVAIVQAPQDYSDHRQNAFKAMCFSEYRGFFHIGMVTRNERNAIIQHGTMTMVCKNALEEVGGWSTSTITEDAELGFMIFAQGHQAVYTSTSYGKGVMPSSFIDYKTQRFRWAYGAMQILRHHAGELLGFTPSKLSAGQRYHFISGWLPWIADGINLIFNFAAIAWSLAIIIMPDRIDPPLVIFSILPLALFVFKIVKVLYLYHGIGIVSSLRETCAAAISGLALSHTIAKAMWLGLFTDGRPFVRTPKHPHSTALFKAVASASEEAYFTIALWLSAGTLYCLLPLDTLDIILWVIVLLVQSIPYFSAVLMSIISAYPSLSAQWLCAKKLAVIKK